MWNRGCPLCFTRVPRALILARSHEFACPACHASLELSRPSAALASLGGILGAFLVGRWARLVSGTSEWTLRIFAVVLAFGFCSAVLLFFFADLIVRPKFSADAFPHAKP
jgi:hypothetical protein